MRYQAKIASLQWARLARRLGRAPSFHDKIAEYQTYIRKNSKAQPVVNSPKHATSPQSPNKTVLYSTHSKAARTARIGIGKKIDCFIIHNNHFPLDAEHLSASFVCTHTIQRRRKITKLVADA